jgi:hypothetical protein
VFRIVFFLTSSRGTLIGAKPVANLIVIQKCLPTLLTILLYQSRVYTLTFAELDVSLSGHIFEISTKSTET